jgi:hypothetical protein
LNSVGITQDHPSQTPPVTPPPTPRWTRARVAALVVGIGMLIAAAAALIGAAALQDLDDRRRDGDFLTSDTQDLTAAGFALAVEDVDLDGLPDDLIGKVRFRATSGEDSSSVFVGVARTDDARSYLADVAYSTVDDFDDSKPDYVEHAGGAPTGNPAESDIWVAQVTGPGTQSLDWTPTDGSWTVVVMNGDATQGIDVTTDVGATAPIVTQLIVVLYALGGLTALAGAGLTFLVVRRTRRTPVAR